MWSLDLGEGLRIDAPRCGAGALIYYHGYSEPETARFVLNFLQPGMVFFDVGAHIGEYTLLASRKVGPTGRVHAFEPQPDTLELLKDNVESNGIWNVRLNSCALADRDGEVEFAIRSEPSLSSIVWSSDTPRGGEVLRTVKVRARTLDGYCREHGSWPDLIKIDVEGAELLVLRGAERLLAVRPERAPCVVFEYGPESYVQFGCEFKDLRTMLERSGFRLFRLDPWGRPISLQGTGSVPDGTRNIVASKKHFPEPSH